MEGQRTVQGCVVRLRCNACSAALATFSFMGDSDTTTEALCALSACGKPELAIVELPPEEWRRGYPSDDFERQVSATFGVGDLHATRLVRMDGLIPPSGLSLEEFREQFRPPKPVFACLCCASGECHVIDMLSVRDFARDGGRIHMAKDLTLV